MANIATVLPDPEIPRDSSAKTAPQRGEGPIDISFHGRCNKQLPDGEAAAETERKFPCRPWVTRENISLGGRSCPGIQTEPRKEVSRKEKDETKPRV